MFNKKLLATLVASTLSVSAFADVDLDADTGSVTVATDSIAYKAAVAAGGDIVLTSNGSVDVVDANAGFSIAAGTNRFIRYDLTNATFNVAATDADLTNAGGDVADRTITLAGGGTAGTSFVIYEFSDSGDAIGQADDFQFDIPDLRVTGTGATIQYRLYETGVDAVAGNSSTLAESSGNLVNFGTANSGEFVSSETATATVDSNFRSFEVVAASADGFASATQARLGDIDVSDLLTAGRIDLDGTAMTLAKLLDADQTLQFEGDFSFGTDAGDWFVDDSQDCSSAVSNIVFATNNTTTGTIANFNATTAGQLYICVTVSGTETIADQSADISVTLVDDSITDTAGQTNYDTTAIEIPILSTHDNYNQRIVITNNGGAANYSTSFVDESGTTSAAGSAATGTIAANSVTVIRAADMVTLTGGTRTSAVINIEAQEANIEAVSQQVNLTTQTTDTIILVVDGNDADDI